MPSRFLKHCRQASASYPCTIHAPPPRLVLGASSAPQALPLPLSPLLLLRRHYHSPHTLPPRLVLVPSSYLIYHRSLCKPYRHCFTTRAAAPVLLLERCTHLTALLVPTYSKAECMYPARVPPSATSAPAATILIPLPQPLHRHQGGYCYYCRLRPSTKARCHQCPYRPYPRTATAAPCTAT